MCSCIEGEAIDFMRYKHLFQDRRTSSLEDCGGKVCYVACSSRTFSSQYIVGEQLALERGR